MKFSAQIILTAMVLLSGRTAAQDPFTYETTANFGSTGDFNGDGRRDVVIADRMTGDVRVAFQQVSGSFVWSAPQPSGIESPETLTVGRFYSVDGVAMGSSIANRVHLFSLGSPFETLLPTPYYPTAPGPSALAAMNVDNANTTDLITVGEALPPLPNQGKAKAYQALVNLVGTPASAWSASFSGVTARINPARPKSTEAPRLCKIFFLPGASTATFYLETVTATGLSSAIPASGITPNTRYVPTSLDGGALTQFLFWEPSSTAFQVRRIQEPSAGTFIFGPAGNFTLPLAIEMITPVPQGATGRIAVLFSNGTAAVYGFNGVAAPSLVQTLAGTGHEMILPLESGGFLLGSGLRGTSPTWKKIIPSGATYAEAFSGALEQSPVSRVSNILFLSAEPFVNPGAETKQLTRFRDWTTVATVGGGISWNVLSQGFSASGLNAPQSTTLSGTAAGQFPLLNQYLPNLSIFVLQSRAGIDPLDVIFSPPPGTYPPPPADNIPSVTVNLAPTTTGCRVFYRSSPTGNFIELGFPGNIQIASTRTIEAYAQKSNGVRSPVRKATYTISAPTALAAGAGNDLDGDGMTDQWERAFGLNSPSGDADGDGVNNLSEYIGGTDPQNSASAPPVQLALAGSRITIGGVNYLRLEWQDMTAVLKRSTDLSAWGAPGGTIETTAKGKRLDVPLGNGAAPRAFFRLEK